jgi:hypothetical protein
MMQMFKYGWAPSKKDDQAPLRPYDATHDSTHAPLAGRPSGDVALRSAGGNGASVNDTVCDEEMR